MNAETTGILFGAAIGIVLCIVIFKICNKNNKIKSEYDERQLAIRGKSFKYGFYTAVIYLALLTFYCMTDFALPFAMPAISFLGVALSIGVMAIHSILNGAYWGLNNDKKKYGIIFIACAIINLLNGVVGIIEGDILQGLQIRLISLECGLLLLIVGIVIIINEKTSSKKADDWEE